MKKKIIPIRFSDNDYNIILKEAEKLRISVSTLIRMIVLQNIIKKNEEDNIS